MKRKKTSQIIRKVIFYGVLLLIMVIAIFPFFWMIISSITPEGKLFSLTPSLIPGGLSLEHFINLPSRTNIFRNILNSLLVSLSTTGAAVLLASFGSYSLSRFSFTGGNIFTIMLILLYMLPGILFLIPLFVLLSRLGLTDTLYGLIICYATFTLPFLIWVLKGYFASIPRELEEAALIDGCTRVGALFKIVFPLAAPGIAAAAIFAFMGSWNEFLFASVFIASKSNKTLPIALSSFQSEFETNYGGLMAFAIIQSLPVVIFYTTLQRFIVRGLTRGGVK